jgi:hypothetical protein
MQRTIAVVNIPASSPASQAAPTADVDRAPETQSPHASSSSAKPRTMSPGIAGLSNRQSATPTAGRRAAPVPTRTAGMTPAAGQGLPGIVERVSEMKSYLAELRAAHAAQLELRRPRDAQFLDLLVAMENMRDPKLDLSAHHVDYKALHAGARDAVSDLASRVVAGMQTGGSWRAVVSMDTHEVALSVQHDAQRPHHLSIVAVDSTSGHFSSQDWGTLAMSLGVHLNDALARQGKPREAKVWVNRLNTGTQKTSEGGAIFAIAAARDMPGEPGIERLHEQTLAQAAREPAHFASGTNTNPTWLGARFFKHMTQESSMQALLATRPELEDQPVNRKQQTLRDRQATHLARHWPPFGTAYTYSDSYERKRIRMVKRAIRHFEATTPELLSARLDHMAMYLGELRRAQRQGTPLPEPRDADFIDLLAGAENTRDDELRLSTHEVDLPQLAAGHVDAVDDLWTSVAEGVRSGADWQATLDLNGHFAALSARHDPQNPAHVSLVVLDGAGSPLTTDAWQTLTTLLGARLFQMQQDTDDARSIKVWLTHCNVSAGEPAANSALFAVRAAREMKADEGIAGLHLDALTEARRSPEDIVVSERNGDELFDPEYFASPGTGENESTDGSEENEPRADAEAYDPRDDARDYDPTAEATLLAEQIEMYRSALSQFERSLASMYAARWAT